MKNNRGFTLVEVLAVLVILVLIMTIITPKVFKQFEHAEKVTDQEQINALINTSKIYMNQNSNLLPAENDTYIISLDDLKESGLIKSSQILNPSTKEELKGCILVKYENNKYKYEYKEENEQITVTFDPQGGTLQETSKNVILGEKYGTLPTPTREGYTFMGWRGKNMFTGLVKGKGIRANDGVVGDNNYAATSDYIEVDIDSNNYYLTGMTSNLWSFVSFYNENKEYKGRTGGNAREKMIINSTRIESTPSITVAGNVKYIRINQYENIYATGKIDDVDGLQIQLELGDTATEYEPYQEYTSSTTVTKQENHTLYAIWQANE